MKLKSLAAAVGALALFMVPLSAKPVQTTFGNLIAALNNVNVQTGNVQVLVVDLSNVLRGANIEVLNRSLNNINIEVLRGADIDVVEIQNVLNNLSIDVNIENILNDLNVNVEDVVVAINVLTGQVIVLVP